MNGEHWLPTVELKHAYYWVCEECDEPNFALPSRAELNDEQREAAYRTFHDMEDFEQLPIDWEQFDMVQIPEEVECNRCGASFATRDEVDAE